MYSLIILSFLLACETDKFRIAGIAQITHQEQERKMRGKQKEKEHLSGTSQNLDEVLFRANNEARWKK